MAETPDLLPSTIVDHRGWAWERSPRDRVTWYLKNGRETDDEGRTRSGPHIWLAYCSPRTVLDWGPWAIGYGGSPIYRNFPTSEAALEKAPEAALARWVERQAAEIHRSAQTLSRVLEATRHE